MKFLLPFQYCFIRRSLQSVSHKMLKDTIYSYEKKTDSIKNSIDADLITFFLDVTSIRILHVITDLPKSVSQISKETKIPLNTVYYKMRKLTGQKIIKVSGNINNLGRRHLQYQSKLGSFASPQLNWHLESKVFVSVCPVYVTAWWNRILIWSKPHH